MTLAASVESATLMSGTYTKGEAMCSVRRKVRVKCMSCVVIGALVAQRSMRWHLGGSLDLRPWPAEYRTRQRHTVLP